ncbi:MAG: magnesium transporter [Candidatus Bathyarchaeia archaeon]
MFNVKGAIRISNGSLYGNFWGMFKQTIVAYLFDIAGLIAGFLIAYQLDVFKHYPWALALYPALISTRIINGLLSGHLSTALHLGTINPQFLGNTKTFHKLIQAIIVLTLITSLTVSVISLFFGYLILGLKITDFPAILSVMVSTLALGLVFSLVTIKVAFVSFKRGLDPDIVVYPVIATLASVFITLCYVGVLRLMYVLPGVLIIVAIGLAHVFLVLYLVSIDRNDPEFLRTVRESLLMMMLVAVIVTLTGTIFGGLTKFTQKEIVTIVPALLTAYPALINNISNVGSVVGSTANTKLALGLLRPTFSSIKNHAKNITSAWLASFLIFVILALSSLAINRVSTLPGIINVVAIIGVSNVIAVVGIVIVSYGIAILTFRRGLNPENFVIPLETSFATIITSTALLVTLLLLTLH